MKEKFYNDHWAALLAVLIFSSAVGFTGLTKGLPSRERLSLLFENNKQMEDSIPVMISARDAHYGKVKKIEQSGAVYVGQTLSDGGAKQVEKMKPEEIVGSLRSFFLGSYIGDETWTISIISRMNPKKLDFNPKTMQYGGAYIYLLCLIAGVSHLLGFISLSPDISYFFAHPEAVARLFLVFRFLSALSLVATATLLFWVVKKFYDARTALLASALLYLSPTVIIYSHVAKPHIYAMFWVLLSFYFAVRILQNDDKRYYVLGGISSGLAVGTIFTSGLIFLSLLFAEYLKRGKVLKIFNKNILLSVTCLTAVFLVTNPYAVFSNLMLSTSASMDSTYNLGAFKFSGIMDTVNMFFSGAINWTYVPLIILGVAAVFRSASKLEYLLLFTTAELVFVNVFILRHAGVFCSAVPFIAIICGLAVRWLCSNGKLVKAGLIYLMFVLTISGWNAFMVLNAFCGKPHLMTAGEWINSNIPKGSTIGLGRCEYIIPANYPYMRFLDYGVYLVDYDFFPADGAYIPEYAVALYFNVGPVNLAERLKKFYVIEKEFLNPRNIMQKIVHDCAYPYIQPDVRIYRRKKILAAKPASVYFCNMV